MPRTARIVVKGSPHHVTQRGINKQKIFLDVEDYCAYSKLFEKNREKYDLDVITYCLMPNHVHFSLIPKEEDSLAKLFRSCHMLHSQHFNRKYERKGHLWQCRFYSCPMDERHSYLAARYIENNPVRSDLVKDPEEWEWSSARVHLLGDYDRSIIKMADARKIIGVQDWRECLNMNISKEEIKRLEESTYSGKPVGNEEFIENLARVFGEKVRKLSPGRPKIGLRP
jgi:putative transposase